MQPLCDQAIELYLRGLPAEAERLCVRIIAVEPANSTSLHLLGIIRVQQQRYAEALDLIGASLKAEPNSVAALSNYSHILKALGRLEEALNHQNMALAIDPNHIEGFINQGSILTALNRAEDALASYDNALAIKSDSFEALNNRGTTLRHLKRFEEALASLEKAQLIKPDSVETLYNCGLTLKDLNRMDEALACYQSALALKPGDAEVLNNKGLALWSLRRLNEALSCYDAALAIKTDYADAWFNRGNVLWALGLLGEALKSREKALALDPNNPFALGAVAAAASHLCDWSRTEEIAAAMKTHIREKKSVISPFVLLGYSDDALLLQQCAEHNIEYRTPVRAARFSAGRTYRREKLRIAYLSADFNRHATSYLMAELFEAHDRSRFDVLGISLGESDGSDFRSRLVKTFDSFHDARETADHEVADFLAASNVDIAVDLNGHTQNCRPGILAHRPCAVQVNYLGYPGTMGASFIDYIIADSVVLPFDQQPFFTERIVHLPDCYQVNDSRRVIAAETPSRADAGLPEQGFVFCCFNGNWKITPPVFDVWMRLLAGLPGSVLWLIHNNDETSARLRAEADKRGIDPQRIIFARRLSPEKHLARHRLADLFLDTLPYNAHTTASDSLWAGVPVISCLGKSFAGRVAASLLRGIGLADLVTHTLEDYEILAHKLADDHGLLLSFRGTLQRNLSVFPLFDTDRFRRNIETAYTTMWDVSSRGEPPRSFALPGGYCR